MTIKKKILKQLEKLPEERLLLLIQNVECPEFIGLDSGYGLTCDIERGCADCWNEALKKEKTHDR